MPVAIVYAGVLALWFFADLSKGRVLFYAAFAVTITASVQLVGVFLVFASLIIPVLAATALPRRIQLAAAYGVGLVGYFAGLFASAMLDVPTGAAVVCALALAAIVFASLRSVATPATR
jgi:zinc/manganese transport system permease protein